MNWEKTAQRAGQIMLWLLEAGFKLFACITGIVIFETKGAFGERLSIGFSSLPSSLRSLTEFPSKVSETITLIIDYNTFTAAEFNQLYGEHAVGELLASLNVVAEYLLQLYRNLVYYPLESILAAAIGFCSFYLLARILRFYRQEGKGSYFTRLERKLGEKIFEKPVTTRQVSSDIKKSNPIETRQKKKTFIKSKIPIKKAQPLVE